MNAKLFLLSVCLGTANAAPAEIYTYQPAQMIAELLAAGETVSNVIIKNAE